MRQSEERKGRGGSFSTSAQHTEAREDFSSRLRYQKDSFGSKIQLGHEKKFQISKQKDG